MICSPAICGMRGDFAVYENGNLLYATAEDFDPLLTEENSIAFRFRGYPAGGQLSPI